MFPKKDSDAYIKSTGERSTLGQMIGSGGGGGSDLPPHSAADAGKVLAVTDTGALAWSTVSGGGNRYAAPTALTPNIDIVTTGKGAE